jgi:hypothetical protein
MKTGQRVKDVREGGITRAARVSMRQRGCQCEVGERVSKYSDRDGRRCIRRSVRGAKQAKQSSNEHEKN